MEAKETKLKGCFVIQPRVFEDERGYFFESFNQKAFSAATGHSGLFVQDNQSRSSYGVLRGLHMQMGEHAQAKLVQAVEGSVLDVAVDCREGSATYGEWVAVELTAENKTQLFVPRGFAHGFVVLSETAVFAYKCDNFYNKASECGVLYNDATLNIDWKIDTKDVIQSEKDQENWSFSKYTSVHAASHV